MSVIDSIKNYARDSVASTGVKVYIKTDLGPELQVFDSDAPAGKSGGALPIRYAVRVTDRNGVELANYGEYPKTSLIKAALVWGALGAGVYLILAGALRTIEAV